MGLKSEGETDTAATTQDTVIIATTAIITPIITDTIAPITVIVLIITTQEGAFTSTFHQNGTISDTMTMTEEAAEGVDVIKS